MKLFYPHLSRTHFNFYLDKTTNKPTDKTTTDQPTDIPTNNPNKNSTETTINPTEKPTNEPTDNPTNKPTDNPTNKPTDEPCNGNEKCTADDVNSYCNTDTGACECKKGFTADEASDKCVKGIITVLLSQFETIILILVRTNFHLYLDIPTLCTGDGECIDANTYCNTESGTCDCNEGFQADESSGECVITGTANSMICISHIVLNSLGIFLYLCYVYILN